MHGRDESPRSSSWDDSKKESPAPPEGARRRGRRSSRDEHDPTKQAREIRGHKQDKINLEFELQEKKAFITQLEERIQSVRALAAADARTAAEKLKAAEEKVKAAEEKVKAAEEKVETTKAAAKSIATAKALAYVESAERQAERNTARIVKSVKRKAEVETSRLKMLLEIVSKKNAVSEEKLSSANAVSEVKLAAAKEKAETAERNLSITQGHLGRSIAANDKFGVLGLRCLGVFGGIKSEMRKSRLLDTATPLKIVAPMRMHPLDGSDDTIMVVDARSEDELAAKVARLGGELIEGSKPIWVAETDVLDVQQALQSMGNSIIQMKRRAHPVSSC